jgi:hypothetical protein
MMPMSLWLRWKAWAKMRGPVNSFHRQDYYVKMILMHLTALIPGMKADSLDLGKFPMPWEDTGPLGADKSIAKVGNTDS